MTKQARPVRDAFAFSLGGITTISSFVIAPAIADDRLNQIRDDRPKQTQGDRNRKPRWWMRIHSQPA